MYRKQFLLSFVCFPQFPTPLTVFWSSPAISANFTVSHTPCGAGVPSAPFVLLLFHLFFFSVSFQWMIMSVVAPKKKKKKKTPLATPVHRGHVRCTGGAPQNGAQGAPKNPVHRGRFTRDLIAGRPLCTVLTGRPEAQRRSWRVSMSHKRVSIQWRICVICVGMSGMSRQTVNVACESSPSPCAPHTSVVSDVAWNGSPCCRLLHSVTVASDHGKLYRLCCGQQHASVLCNTCEIRGWRMWAVLSSAYLVLRQYEV